MKILMVCLGNICRSPLAQGILENKTTHLNVEVDSAGTASYHIGKSPDIRSIEIAAQHDINLRDQKARQFNKTDFKKFDIIYVMDNQNYNHLTSLTSNNTERQKIKFILDELNPNSHDSVPDPYYGGIDGFLNVYNLLDKACYKIVQNIE